MHDSVGFSFFSMRFVRDSEHHVFFWWNKNGIKPVLLCIFSAALEGIGQGNEKKEPVFYAFLWFLKTVEIVWGVASYFILGPNPIFHWY